MKLLQRKNNLVSSMDFYGLLIPIEGPLIPTALAPRHQ